MDLFGDGWRTLRLTTIGCLFAALIASAAPAAELDLSAYRGKVVYVDFWASWCAPCRESFPWMSDLLREYGPRNFVVIAVNVDKDKRLAETFLNGTMATFPIVYDPRGDFASSYRITGMPSAVLIDRAGRVRYRHTGFTAKKKDEYEEHVRALVDESPP